MGYLHLVNSVVMQFFNILLYFVHSLPGLVEVKSLMNSLMMKLYEDYYFELD